MLVMMAYQRRTRNEELCIQKTMRMWTFIYRRNEETVEGQNQRTPKIATGNTCLGLEPQNKMEQRVHSGKRRPKHKNKAQGGAYKAITPKRYKFTKPEHRVRLVANSS